MNHPITEFLDMELLARLPSLELRARLLVEGFLAGLHRSPQKGSSVEFMEYRDYQQGDEPKIIDWKTYARTDRLHVRLHEEETNMRVYILLDKSASMNYRGSDALMTKWDYARSLAAALLLFLHRQRDSAALGFAGGGLEGFMRGEGSKSAHMHSMISMLYRDADSTQSNLAAAIGELSCGVKRRSIVIVISDFYESAEKLKEALKKISYEKCETLLFHILDPAEIDFDFKDAGIFTELETGAELLISPDLIRKKYRNAMSEHIADIQSAARSLPGDSLLLPTNTPPLKALGLYLARRGT